MSLEGKVALVTGAGRGIGAGIARVLCERGMVVAVSDRDGAAAKAASDRLPRSISVRCDVTQKAEVEAMMTMVEHDLGPLWLLVNNAGVYHTAPSESLAEEAWDADIDVDLKGTFLCSQAAIRSMMPREAGRIVNIGSIAGLIARTCQIGYCAAKAGVAHLTRCLAVEMAPHGITVNCVCPGMTGSEMLAESARARGLRIDDYVPLVPAGRLADPADHAHMVAFLATEEAHHITGQVIAVDGAQSLNLPLVKTT